MRKHINRLKQKLAAFSLAAGVLAGSGTALGDALTDPTVAYYKHGGGGWFDSCPHFASGEYDLILFKLDGTVLVDDTEIDPVTDRTGAITLMHRGLAGPDSSLADPGPGAGIVAYYHEVGMHSAYLANYLETDDPIGSASGFTTEDSHFNMFWFPVLVGDWAYSPSPRGYMGFYIDDVDGRHYGWADITVGQARNEVTLHRFAYETTAGETILAGEIPEPTTMSLLALGAVGIAAVRRR